MADLKKGEKTLEYQNKYFHVYSQEVDFGSFTKKYYVAHYGSKACLLLINQGSILLTQQYRFLIDRPIWEIPGGKIEEGEDGAGSAVRETEEETGIRGLNVKPLIKYPQGLDCVHSGAQIFYTTEFKEVKEFTADPAEVESIKWFSLEDCLGMIRSGEIADHTSIIGLLYYQYLRSAGQI